MVSVLLTLEVAGMTRVAAVGLALAVAFFLAGLVNAIVILVPWGMGDVSWELTAFGEFAITMVPFTLGLSGLGAIGLMGGYRWLSATTAMVALLVAVVGGVGALVLATNAPLVWRTVAQGVPPALKYATVKSAALLVVYGIGLLALSVYLFRATFTRGSR